MKKMLIAFIGPDGCGKTTVALAVLAHLKRKGINVLFFEMNFGILPRLRDIASVILRRSVGQIHAPGEYMAGMKNPPNSPVKGSVYMIWYTLDYILGRLRYSVFLRKEAVVFARYIYDYGYQRSYCRVPMLFHKVMLCLAPTPDFVFTINRDCGDIFRCKPELAVEEIRRQQAKIMSMLTGQGNFHILDGSLGVENTVASALAIIEGTK